MKTSQSIKLITAVILFSSLVSLKVYAQEKIGYFPIQKGTKYEVTTYDKKNKVTNVTISEVIESNSTNALVHVISKDDKGKELLNSNIDVNLMPEGIEPDQKKLIEAEVSSRMTDPTVKTNVTGNNLIIPYELTIGQSLASNEIVLHIITSAMNMKMIFKTFDRKVVAQEKITVPAGTFDCMVITANLETKLLVLKKSTVKMWIAKGVGMVKQETYSSNGKVDKTEIMTSFASK